MIRVFFKRIVSIILISAALLTPLYLLNSGYFKTGKYVYKTYKDWHIQKIAKQEIVSVEIYHTDVLKRKSFNYEEDSQTINDLVKAFTDLTIAKEVYMGEMEGPKYEITFEFPLNAKRTVHFTGNYVLFIDANIYSIHCYEITSTDELQELIKNLLRAGE